MPNIPPWAEKSYFVQQVVLYSQVLHPVDALIGVVLILVVFYAAKTGFVQLTRALSKDGGFRKATSGILMGPEMKCETAAVMISGMQAGFRTPEVRATMIAMAKATIQDPAMFQSMRDAFVHALRDPEMNAAVRETLKEFLKDPSLHKAVAAGATSNLMPDFLKPWAKQSPKRPGQPPRSTKSVEDHDLDHGAEYHAGSEPRYQSPSRLSRGSGGGRGVRF